MTSCSNVGVTKTLLVFVELKVVGSFYLVSFFSEAFFRFNKQRCKFEVDGMSIQWPFHDTVSHRWHKHTQSRKKCFSSFSAKNHFFICQNLSSDIFAFSVRTSRVSNVNQVVFESQVLLLKSCFFDAVVVVFRRFHLGTKQFVVVVVVVVVVVFFIQKFVLLIQRGKRFFFLSFINV